MRFKGTQTTGKNKGDVIEYAAEEKVSEALKLAVSRHFLPDYNAYAKSIRCESLNFSPAGDLLKKKWQNNSYRAQVKAHVSRIDVKKDRLMAGKDMEFTIEFKDVLDANGLPDLEVTSFRQI